ncbi:glycosyl transferase family 2 [Enemella dayhoffiae]|uniref:Glycosyl transferase family 2 n=1 Tax=Enemella dayhoffiae TaxID=2016507 RepID=A0A255GZI7_9ACTN|nr:glycosyl transferase family 2 [Enemella dayhoffiae]
MSYVMPVLNEENYLAEAVATVLDQDYPGETELVIALGPSRDNTTALAERVAARDPRVRIVHNPGTDIPKGLNLAIAETRHPIVIRVDAHSELPADYTRIGVDTLRRTGAANVGGLMAAAGRTPFQRAVARAYNSPMGLGGGTYHHGTEAGPCESAYLGIFRREALSEAGGYDESVRRGEDWELNLRIREHGHLVWFTPELKVTYWPRDSRQKLARQFWSTGVWRGALVREVADKTPPRFFAPGLLVAGFATSAALAAVDLVRPLRGPAKLLRLAHLAPAAYATFLAGVMLRSDGTLRERADLAQALTIMHTTWGAGFLSGVIRGGGDTVDTSRH